MGGSAAIAVQSFFSDDFFVDDARFDAMVAQGGFLEWARVFDRKYGTGRAATEAVIASGTSLLLDIDVQGARQVRSRIPDVVKIFVFPPSRAVLEARLRDRASDAPSEVARRLAAAAAEMAEFGEYDYAIINDDLETAAEELRSIIVARRAGRSRQRERLEAILKTFNI